jgi:hypothetical protein
MRLTTSLVLCLALAACGGGGDDDNPGADGGDDDDPDASADDPCGFASESYLPYEVGNSWTFKITDLGNGDTETKAQSIDAEGDVGDFGTVYTQVTGKLNGTTKSYVKRDGDRLVRVYQEDLDGVGASEKVTLYDPGQIRIDETAARLEPGEEWDESYDSNETPNGGAEMTTATVDHWEVVADDEACTAPLGSFTCLHLKRTRTMGGASVKDYWYAKGVGKVKESGDSQTEELTACGTE